jgi:hypothetical protein
MSKDRELVTPVIAVVFATLAVGVLVSAIVWRWSRGGEADAAVAPRMEAVQAQVPVDAGPVPVPSPSAGTEPRPTIGTVTARVATADRGVEITLETAITVPVGIGPRPLVSIIVRCHLDGEWYDGYGSILVDRAGAGDHVVTNRVRVGGRYQLGALPDVCHVGFEYRPPGMRGFDPSRWVAQRCWNGQALVDGVCPSRPLRVGGKPVLALTGLRVTSRARYLRVAADAELLRALDSWTVKVGADCTLPAGATRQGSGTIYLSRFTPGRPFEVDASLFLRDHLPAAPEACTFALVLEDMHQMAREPLGTYCWRGDQVTTGAC